MNNCSSKTLTVSIRMRYDLVWYRNDIIAAIFFDLLQSIILFISTSGTIIPYTEVLWT
jgi:hypothetical protein